MGKSKNGKVLGRPLIEIDQEQFEKLCTMQCTLEEIAGWFQCSHDTIEAWVKRTYFDDDGEPVTFSVAHKRFSSNGKISLRRTQWKMAEKSVTMAIFLGKQYLGQRDNQVDIEDTGELEMLIDAIRDI